MSVTMLFLLLKTWDFFFFTIDVFGQHKMKQGFELVCGQGLLVCKKHLDIYHSNPKKQCLFAFLLSYITTTHVDLSWGMMASLSRIVRHAVCLSASLYSVLHFPLQAHLQTSAAYSQFLFPLQLARALVYLRASFQRLLPSPSSNWFSLLISKLVYSSFQ